MKKQCEPKYRPHSIIFTQPTLTQQHQKDEVDVNKIMKRYVKTGVVDHINTNQPNYGDVSPLSYHESLSVITEAQSMFEDLPAQARKNFDNDPSKFLEFVQDPDNKDRLTEMALNSTEFNKRNDPPAPVEQTEKEPAQETNAPASE